MNSRNITINGKTIKGYAYQTPTTPDEAWEVIKQERTLRKQEGGFKVGVKWYHSDQPSRIQQIGLVLLGANIPANLVWKTMDGSFIQMTQTLAGQIFAAGASSDAALFQTAEVKKSETANMTAEQLALYDFAAGWPQAYWE